MKLIYERSRPGRRASAIPRHANLPAPEVPERLRRSEPPRLPEVPEFELIRHFTELSTRNFGIDNGFDGLARRDTADDRDGGYLLAPGQLDTSG